MHLTPYVRVDGTPFTARECDVRAARGAPGRVGRNAVDLRELDYGDAVYRFQDGGGLEEVTRRAPVLHLPAVAVPFTALAGFVRAQDANAFSRAGFLVSPAYGVAFVPEAPDWVTALARHSVPAWRAL